MKNSPAAAPLLDVVRHKVQPWAQERMSRTIIATARFAEFSRLNKELPPGVTVSRNAWTNKGKTLHGKRKFGDTDTVVTMWEADGLCTKNEPVLACIVKGFSDFNLGEYTLHCPSGIFILLPPGVPQPTGAFPHFDTSQIPEKGQENSCDILWLSFWDNMLRCWICHSYGNSHRSADPGESAFVSDDEINAHFRSLMRETEQRELHYPIVCGHFIAIVFTVICRLLEEKRFLPTYFWGDVSQETVKRENAIEHSQEYIRTHLSETLTLAKVARIVGLSRTQFAQDFTRQTGQTFNRFVTASRLQHAQHLLESTTWPLNTVSYLIGLSPSQFREVFRSNYGISPIEYRRRLRSNLMTLPQGPL